MEEAKAAAVFARRPRARDEEEHKLLGGDDMVAAPPHRRSLISLFALAFVIFVMACYTAFLLISGISSRPVVMPTDGGGELKESPRLLLRRDAETFKIAIFSDLHFGEKEGDDKGAEQDAKSTKLMASVLDAEKPDFVVLNGDLISGEETRLDNATEYVHRIVKPMAERNVPWGSTYGNHDSSFTLSREGIHTVEKQYPLSFTNSMGGLRHSAGLTNYYVLIEKEVDGKDAVRPVVAVLWFLDSRGGDAYQQKPGALDDWVAPEVVAWFRRTSASLKARHGKGLRSLAFVHIPPRVFRDASKSGLEPALFPGLNADDSLAVQGAKVGHGGVDDPFAVALRYEEGLHSVYSGHDHGSAWCAPWPKDWAKKWHEGRHAMAIEGRHGGGGHHDDDDNDNDDDDKDEGHDNHQDGKGANKGGKGPILCFSRRTGYGGYGDWDRGARVLQLTFVDTDGDGDYSDEGEMAVDTWFRMEGRNDGVTRVSLNETYGVDRYPVEIPSRTEKLKATG